MLALPPASDLPAVSEMLTRLWTTRGEKMDVGVSPGGKAWL